MNKANLAIAATPSFGPAIVTVFGIDVPVLALGLSVLTLLLTRQIAKPPPRALSKIQEACLTLLLLILLFLIVTGNLFVSRPVGVGTAVVWAIGLGLSGILILELIASSVTDWIRRLISAFRDDGGAPRMPPGEERD